MSESNNVNAVSTYRNPNADANVLLYIDNSNMFESAKKFSGHKKGFINGTPDFLCRIDIGKLIAKAVGDREVLIGKLYGSEPPALDTVWDAIRKNRVHVETFRRSKVTGKEKEIDTSLVAAAIQDIIEQKDVAGKDRTIILFSGDRDLLCVLKTAVQYGYNVEICAFNRSINKEVERRASEEPNKLKVKYIDEFFHEITFSQFVWSHRNIPSDRSIVASVNLSGIPNKSKFFRYFVETSWEIFHYPMMGKYLDGEYRHIVLIPCVRYKEHDTHFNFYKDIQPFMHMLQERFYPICMEVVTWREFLDKNSNYGNDSTVEIVNRYQRLQLDDEEEDEYDEDEFFDSHPKLNAIAAVYPEEEQDARAELQHSWEDDEEHDNVEDNYNYQAVSRTKTKTKSNIYSKSCNRKFWCWKGLKCDFKHTDKEREFFKAYPEFKFRKFYKIKPCYHKVCKYNRNSYLCPYAHNVEEARCLSCGGNWTEQEPHWMDQCPWNEKQEQGIASVF